MARADLLKRILESHNERDDEAFRQAALEVVEDERKKRHTVLANELQKILTGGSTKQLKNTDVDLTKSLAPLPKDPDRGMPLVDVKLPHRHLESLVLTKTQQSTIYGVLEEFRSWDVLSAHGLSPSTRMLFFGPPGCGKTATAEAVSAQLGIPLLYVRFDSVVSSLLGETAANLRRIFDYAEHERWVLFFDEFDAIGRSRATEQDHTELKRVVNTFLQLLDHFSGQSLVIAATNHHMFLDSALWRRFDEIVSFDLPSKEQVKELVRNLMGSWLTEQPRPKDFSAMEGMSHADIERACLNSKKQAVMNGDKRVSIQTFRGFIEKEQRRLKLITQQQNNGTIEMLGSHTTDAG